MSGGASGVHALVDKRHVNSDVVHQSLIGYTAESSEYIFTCSSDR